MNVVVVNKNPVFENTALAIEEKVKANTTLISKKEEFTYDYLSKVKPDYIFVLHWSHIIPSEIHENFNCILFHMTDLPFGRGGSPLQNLIVRGYEKTQLSAIQVEEGLDTGDVYLKKELLLCGTAEEIFIRAGTIMVNMIEEIIVKQLQPQPQTGQGELFKRRKPKDSDISQLTSLQEVYDYIRMLDAEDYPHAFLENEHFRLEFTRATMKSNHIKADVTIFKK